jgi:hypothetical protein
MTNEEFLRMASKVPRRDIFCIEVSVEDEERLLAVLRAQRTGKCS